MATELLFGMFLRAELAGSLAVLLVLALRLPARRFLGAELAYGLWLLVPATALVSLFPAMPEYFHLVTYPNGVLRSGRFVDWSPVVAHAGRLAPVWAMGAAAMVLALAAAQWRFQASVRARRAGPAATGFWPRMVTPDGYADRFTLEERALIRAHERAHMDRRDPTTNLLIAMLQAAS
ncbi:MAG TPA: M56 family metallopeptidase, partial [Caulobacteraceae bacterium]|nr:M56 family metallopeptidase [Caulobacteraceae bacterium]